MSPEDKKIEDIFKDISKAVDEASKAAGFGKEEIGTAAPEIKPEPEPEPEAVSEVIEEEKPADEPPDKGVGETAEQLFSEEELDEVLGDIKIEDISKTAEEASKAAGFEGGASKESPEEIKPKETEEELREIYFLNETEGLYSKGKIKKEELEKLQLHREIVKIILGSPEYQELLVEAGKVPEGEALKESNKRYIDNLIKIIKKYTEVPEELLEKLQISDKERENILQSKDFKDSLEKYHLKDEGYSKDYIQECIENILSELKTELDPKKREDLISEHKIFILLHGAIEEMEAKPIKNILSLIDTLESVKNKRDKRGKGYKDKYKKIRHSTKSAIIENIPKLLEEEIGEIQKNLSKISEQDLRSELQDAIISELQRRESTAKIVEKPLEKGESLAKEMGERLKEIQKEMPEWQEGLRKEKQELPQIGPLLTHEEIDSLLKGLTEKKEEEMVNPEAAPEQLTDEEKDMKERFMNFLMTKRNWTKEAAEKEASLEKIRHYIQTEKQKNE